MKIAFPLTNKNELAMDFAHAHFIGIYDDVDSSTELIPLSSIEKELGIVYFFDAIISHGLNYVASPYYSYMALRVFKENNIETYKAKGINLSENIGYFNTKGLKQFDVYESLLVGECAKSCSSCGPSCSNN